MALTEVAIRTAQPGKHFDGGGLFLLVTEAGSKLWRFKYRIDGKERLLALGVYGTKAGEVTLKAAREKHGEARKLVAQGIDPSKHRKAERMAKRVSAANSFELVALEWLETKAGEWVEDHSRKVRRWLEQHVFPSIGAAPIGTIEAPEVLEALRKVVKRGTLNTAHRLRETIGSVFRYAIATGRAQRNPAADLRDALPVAQQRHFAAVTDPADVRGLMLSLEGYQGSAVTLAALRLSPLLFQRPGELRSAEWSEVDLDAAEWRIPAKRQKLKRAAKENARTPDHVVPLPTQAVAILRELQRLTGEGKYLFPGLRTASRPMSENTVNAALRRLGYGPEQMTGHGFRHMASTRLNELGWNPDAIERQLSHKDRNTIRATYNQAQYLAERSKMMQAWADYLDGLKAADNVVTLRRKAG